MATAWEDLDDSQFERVVVELARALFGEGVQEFAPGPDGGRDARFAGKASWFPSAAAPWQGTTVFQAKHTSGFNAHFADKAFSGTSKNSILSLEVPRIQKMVQAGSLDNYFLVSNRRLSGGANEQILERLSTECNIAKESIHLVGTEALEGHIYRRPQILKNARLGAAEYPLNPSSYDIAAVIVKLAESIPSDMAPSSRPVERVRYDRKNALNGMSNAYARELERRNLPYTQAIDEFLAHPANRDALEHYEEATAEFQRKILAFGDEFDNFDRLYDRILDTILLRDGFLRSSAKLTKALFFYMYWGCDIGRVEDADSE